MTYPLGSWVRRPPRLSREAGKWHCVESDIAGSAITSCGRRLRPETWHGIVMPLEVADVMPLTRAIGQPQNCHQCDRQPEVFRAVVQPDEDHVTLA